MQPHEKLALVIPALREAKSLPRLLREIRAVLEQSTIPYEILVVDDHSQDGTEELVSSIAGKDARVRLLVRRHERGLAGAILHGWQQTDASILGVMDADLQHPPHLLAELMAKISAGNDLALASRYVNGGRTHRWNPLRKLMSAASVWVTIPLQRSGIRVTDPMSGFFLVRRKCVENIPFRPSGFKLLLEILVRGRIRSVSEVPFAFGVRHAGRSKAGLAVASDYLRLLASLYVARWKEIRFPAKLSID